MLKKKILQTKIIVAKNALFFLSRAPSHHSFTFDSQFLYRLKRKVHLSKSVCGIIHFRFHSLSIKVCIFSTKSICSLTLSVIIRLKTKIIEQLYKFLLLDLWCFKLQEEVPKFNDICVTWSSSKTDMETNFVNLRKF